MQSKDGLTLIHNWQEFATIIPQETDTHYLKIKEDNGWIHPKVDDKSTWEGHHYFSTHTFYTRSSAKHHSEKLQECGFNVELVSWE